MFRIKKTQEPERLKALLDLSRFSVILSYIFILFVLATGITLGFLGGYWGQLWIWTAIGVAFVTMGLMYKYGTEPFTDLRRALGLPTGQVRKKQVQTQPTPADPQEVAKLASSARPMELSVVGAGGLLIIAWLMVLKPF